MFELKNASIKEIHKPENGTSKSGTAWTKQTFVVTFGDKYPTDLALDLWSDKTEFLKDLRESDRVDLKFDVSSNSYNGKYFTNCKCYYLSKVGATQTKQHSNPEPKAESEPSANDGDMPF